MGDMADWVLDQMFDPDFGEFGDEGDEDGLSRSSEMKTCRYCGCSMLWWTMTDNGWRLTDGNGIHECGEFRKRMRSIDYKKDL